MKYTDLKKRFLLTFAPTIAAIAITVSYIPQLLLTWDTKNVEGQSLTFWFLLVIALTGLFLQQVGMLKYGQVKNKTGLMTQAINLFFAALMLIMVIVFGR